MDASKAYGDLVDDPGAFLEKHLVSCVATLAKTGAGQQFYLYNDDLQLAGTDSFKIGTSASTASKYSSHASFTGFGVAILPLSSIMSSAQPPAPTNIPAIVLPFGTGPMLMVTTQLSGCCMVLQPKVKDSAGPFAGHIQPPDSGSKSTATSVTKAGENLETFLAGAQFAGESNAKIALFGANDYASYGGEACKANFIAVRNNNNKWVAYAQIFSASNKSIKKVKDLQLSG